MSLLGLVLGDDCDLEITCETVAGFAGATSVKVALVNLDRSAILAGPWTAAAGYAGANWGGGVVVVPVPGTDTQAVAASIAEVEVQVVVGGKTTTYLGSKRLPLIKGLIP